MREINPIANINWTLVNLYLALTFMGLLSIYSASNTEESFTKAIFMFETVIGKQFVWFMISLVVIGVIFFLKHSWFLNFTELLYLFSILLLILVLFMGEEISGAKSWFRIGGIGFQPSEIAKITTSLMIAKLFSEPFFDFKKNKHKFYTLCILGIPISLILLQPDAGSVLIFLSMVFAFYKSNFQKNYLVISISFGTIFLLILFFNLFITISILTGLFIIIWYYRRKRKDFSQLFILYVILLALSWMIDKGYRYLPHRHKDRIEIVLGIKEDLQGVGFNTHQSIIAIGSGGMTGKGYLFGTQTKLSFIPEQTTDFIFCTIAEEFGFLGTIITLTVFLTMIIQILRLSEKQKSNFAKYYGYFVAMILCAHVLINISMTMGIFPVVGIPLPFISYGGSSFLSFTILLFIFIKFDMYKTTML